MPIRDWTPLAELMLSPHVAGFADDGAVLFTVSDDGDPPTVTVVYAPDTWLRPPCDLYALLSSKATFRIGLNASSRLNFAMASEAGLLGVWSFAINPVTDKIEVISDGEAFSIAITSPPNAWGMTGPISSVVRGSDNVATAQTDWTRDNISYADLTFSITGATSGLTGTFTMPAGVYQGIPEILLDFDDVGGSSLYATYDPLNRVEDCLSRLLQDAMSSPSGGWFYRTDEGPVAIVMLSDYTLDIDTDFCRWLGFDGTEEFVEIDTEDTNTYKQIIANGKPPQVIRLNRCFDAIEPWYQAEVSGAMSADGGIERTHINTLQGWNVSMTFEGNARGAELANLLTAQTEILPYLFSSEVITLYPVSRERRLSGLRLLPTGYKRMFDSSYSAYSTPEQNGYVGALRCALPLDQTQAVLQLQDLRVRALYVPLQLKLYPYVNRQGAV